MSTRRQHSLMPTPLITQPSRALETVLCLGWKREWYVPEQHQDLCSSIFTPYFSSPGKPQTLPSRCYRSAVLCSGSVSKEAGGGNPSTWRRGDQGTFENMYPEGQHPLAALDSFTCRNSLILSRHVGFLQRGPGPGAPWSC